MATLDDLLGTLRKLDRIRAEARRLRDQALEDLTKHPYEPRAGWPQLGDNVERALLLDAIRTGRRRGLVAPSTWVDEVERAALMELEKQTLSDLFDDEPTKSGTGGGSTARLSDDVPVLRAARMMRALVSTPGQAFHPTTLRCYYRIVCELHAPNPPYWSTAGASAGSKGPASAFVTGECVRTVVAFSRALARTGDFFRHIHDFKANLKATMDSRVPAAWSARERDRIEMSTSIDLARLVPDIVVAFGDPPSPGQVESWIDGLAARFHDAIEQPRNAIGGVIAEATELMDRARQSPGRPLREGAHRVALEVLRDALRHLPRLENHVSGRSDPSWDDLAKEFHMAAPTVRRVLQPAHYFLRSVQDQQLSRSARGGGSVDTAELAFATAALGTITGRWDFEGASATVDVLRKVLEEGGTFSTQLPIVVDIKGFKLVTVIAEVVRAVAKILTHIPEQVDGDFAGRLVRILENTRCNEETGGWTHEGALKSDEASWWMTSLAFFASNRIVRMLNCAINAKVFEHFSVTAHEQLTVELDKLFYTDYGISSSEPKRRESGAILLQRLRAALDGSPPDSASQVFSVVLHGPPGTGKTTLLEALAKSAKKHYLTVTPSDILAGGAEEIERRARSVFEALSMLTDAVILFDEFDPIVWKRNPAAKTPTTVFEFLTASILPKLKKLHDAAPANRLVFALATNLVGSLDPAVIREGRFDAKIGIYPPDLLSRAGRLWSQTLREIERSAPNGAAAGWEDRLAFAVAKTNGAPMTSLGKPGWFSPPRGKLKPRTVLHFVVHGTDEVAWPLSEALNPSAPNKEAEGAAAEAARTEWTEWQWVVEWDDRLAGTNSEALRSALDNPPPTSPRGS